MKFILHIFLIAALSILSSAYLPWWGATILAFIVSFVLNQKAGTSFLAGFLGLFLCWGVSAMVLNIGNEGMLANKMGALLGGVSGTILLLVTAVLGGLLGGLASWSGQLARGFVKID